MNLDIGQLLATTSQALPLTLPQMAIPSEPFAVLMDIGAPPPKAGKPTENLVAVGAMETLKTTKPAEVSEATAAEASPAITQANALVFALSSDAKLPGILDYSRGGFADKPTEVDLETAPILVSSNKPLAAPIAVRRAPVERPAVATREPSPDLPLMSIDEEIEDQPGSDDRQDETKEERSVANALVVAPIVPDLATVQVSQAPVPVSESPAVLGDKSIAVLNGPVRTDIPREAASTVAPVTNDLRMDQKPIVRLPDSAPVRIEEQDFETPSQSLATTTPEVVIAKPVEGRKLLAEASATTIVDSDGLPARSMVTKSAPSLTVGIAETPAGTPNILENPMPMQLIKGISDPPIATSSPTAIVDASASTIDTILDRQLDLVRNERWLGELAQDIASTSEGKDRVSFRLMPHQLGRLDVEVSRSNSGLSLTFRTESESAQSILSAAHTRLADELRSQGVRLADNPMFSSDARQFQHNSAPARPAPLIESFTTPADVTEAPEQVHRDGRYA